MLSHLHIFKNRVETGDSVKKPKIAYCESILHDIVYCGKVNDRKPIEDRRQIGSLLILLCFLI